jgi:hypothetical protein
MADIVYPDTEATEIILALAVSLGSGALSWACESKTTNFFGRRREVADTWERDNECSARTRSGLSYESGMCL